MIFCSLNLQFVTQNVAAWCLRGLLDKQQEETLLNLFDIIKRLIQPSYRKEELPDLIADTSSAVALLERDFPLTLQVNSFHVIQKFINLFLPHLAKEFKSSLKLLGKRKLICY